MFIYVNLIDIQKTYTVDEFLPAPKILICNRCNTPGHTENSCKNSTVDICRRCGENRTNLVAHKDCRVKCHHCGGPHEFTDYKCKFIADYRRQLIEELKKHPECLPPDIQLFIPKGYRSDEDRSKSIYNKSAYEYKQYLCQQKRQQQQHIFNLSDRNAWPYLRPNPPATTNTVSQNDLNLSETIKFLSDELKQVQQKHEDE
ncbi:unnamed protein product [Didymodactylos carnosus]|uniref:Uncharacterized protein n=1 Tax=Didymodactylos carnosus TaxID=1234261 RepID=A0A8S2UF56_9BILA|nr:unnamed protein product [Didymodactylos carnosus]